MNVAKLCHRALHFFLPDADICIRLYLNHFLNSINQKGRNFYVSYVFLDDGTVIYLNEYGECERVSENDILTVEFGDKSVEVMLKELRTEAGAEKLR